MRAYKCRVLIMRLQLPIPLLLSSFIVLLLVAVIAIGTVRTVHAAQETPESGERLVVIHDGSEERGFLTKAETVRDAIEDMGISLDKNDLVEPHLDETLVASSYDINIYRARPVTVVDGAVRKKIMSAYRTPSQIVQHADMEFREEDKAEMSMPVGGAMQLTVTRATPLTLVLYGKKETVYTHVKTVAQLLEEKAITLGENDALSLDKNTPITANMVVELWREGKQTITEEEEVKFEIELIQDVDREVGFREVKTPGTPGKRTVTYEIEMRNGVEVSRVEIQSVMITEPKTQIEVVGAKSPFGDDLAAAFAALRQCESGGNYQNKNNPLYRGAYQFSYQTWANNGGYYDPADAPPALQDAAALALYERRGWQPWPACSKKLGLL